jgi:hypothetical protein
MRIMEGSGMADDSATAAAALWAQARDQVTQQSADLDALRNRAAALLSVAAVVGGLFGSRLSHGRLSDLRSDALIGALVLFGAGVLLAVAIAWPRRAWAFAFDLAGLIGEVSAGTASVGEVSISLSSVATSSLEANARKLQLLYWLFSALCLVVGLQVVAWALALI